MVYLLLGVILYQGLFYFTFLFLFRTYACKQKYKNIDEKNYEKSGING